MKSTPIGPSRPAAPKIEDRTEPYSASPPKRPAESMSIPAGMEGLVKRRQLSRSGTDRPPRGLGGPGQEKAGLAPRPTPAPGGNERPGAGEDASPLTIGSLTNELLHAVVSELDEKSRHDLMQVDARFLAQGLVFEGPPEKTSWKMKMDSPAALKAACEGYDGKPGAAAGSIDVAAGHHVDLKLGNGAYTRADLERLPPDLLNSSRNNSLHLASDARLDEEACSFLAEEFTSLKEITLDAPSKNISGAGFAALATNPDLRINAVLGSEADMAAISRFAAPEFGNRLFLANMMSAVKPEANSKPEFVQYA